MQSRETGAAANDYGRRTAQSIAGKLGAQSTSATSNEFVLEGRPVTIRCARLGTTSVGVTYLMLDRVMEVLAAFQEADGSYSILSLGSETFKEHMRPSRSRGPSAGRVGIVSRSAFEQYGTQRSAGLRVVD